MSCLILCQRTTNFMLLLVQLSNWLLKWKEVVKTHLHYLANAYSFCRWVTNFMEWYSACQVLTDSAEIHQGLFKVIGIILNTMTNFIVFFLYMLLSKHTGLIFYMRDAEINTCGVKKAVFAQIMNFSSKCHWQNFWSRNVKVA